jgi:hypothetical protein
MHPVFAWTVPPGEVASSVHIATRPDRTPQGEFYDENVVDTGFVCCSDVRQWAPTQPLFARPYWWMVKTVTLNEFAPAFSTPSPFTVVGNARIRSIRIRRNSYSFVQSSLDVTVGWFSNGHSTTVTVGVYPGRRLVGRVRRVETQTFSPGNQTTYLSWDKPRPIRRGTRLRVVVGVRGAGAVSSASRLVRAP